MKPLQQQTAIVTGASSGIGQGITIALAKEGSRVCINYHSSEKGAKETLDQICEDGSDGFIQQADVSEPKEVEEIFDKAISPGTIKTDINRDAWEWIEI
ncbi:MAG: SDR family NAD(P)-dependent oxidoreductase [Cyclobacteriaceae bacterium]|mgnify:CR=1 FL=1